MNCPLYASYSSIVTKNISRILGQFLLQHIVNTCIVKNCTHTIITTIIYIIELRISLKREMSYTYIRDFGLLRINVS